MRREHRVVVGVLLRDGSVLLGLRAASRRWYPGVWDLPGGHVEPGESPTTALVRELREELGVEAVVEPEVLFGVEADDLELDAHLVTAWSGEVTNRQPEEHDELRFVGPEELPRLELAHPAYPGVLARLMASGGRPSADGV